MERRGDGAELSGNESVVKISVRSPVSVNGKATVTWDDVYVRYDHGIVMLGGAEIADCGMQAVSAVVEDAHEKSNFVRVMPLAVPAEFRTAMFNSVQQAASVKLQRIDGESVQDHEARRTSIESRLWLTRSLLFDVEDITAWSSWPLDTGECRFHVGLQAVSGSAFAQITDGLKACEPANIFAVDESTVGTLLVNVSLSAELTSTARAILAGRKQADPVINTIMTHFEETGTCNAAVSAVLHRQSTILLHGVVDIPSVVAGNLDSSKEFMKELSPHFLGQDFGPVLVKSRLSEGSLSFDIAPSIPALSINAPSISNHRNENTKPQIAQFQLDFRRWMGLEPSSPAARLLVDAERIFDRWQILYDAGPVIEKRHLTSRIEPSFFSLTDRVVNSGDWTADISVRTKFGGLAVDGTIGRDLHRWAIVRQLVSKSNAIELARSRPIKATP